MTERWSRALIWGAAVVVAAALTALVLALSEDPPPERMVIAAGHPDGAYHAYAAELAERIAEKGGPEVVIDETGGSVENLERLASGKADVAFVQSGVASALKDEVDLRPLRSIARVFSEPLWVFHDRDAELDRLLALEQGGREHVAIGAEGSGTQPVALDVLRISGITDAHVELLRLETSEAADRFARNEIDVLFLVASPLAETVQKLLADPETRVLSFDRHRAYTKRLVYLDAVTIEQGLVSPAKDLPRRDLVLLAPMATLVTRESVHPRLVERVMKAATDVFGGGNLIDAAGDLPSGKRLELPQHEAARRYMEEGESWVSRNLPFWAVRLLSRVKLLFIPLIALLLPLFRFLPALSQVRVRRLIKLHYESLRDVEQRLLAADSPDAVEKELEALSQLKGELERLSRRVPGTYQDTVYQWRLHVKLVRDEGLERLEELRRATPE